MSRPDEIGMNEVLWRSLAGRSGIEMCARVPRVTLTEKRRRVESIWIWQRIISPHMAGLATALAGKGCAVTYVAETEMTAGRAQQGWSTPDLGSVVLRMAPSDSEARALAQSAPAKSVHICQGIRSNGRVGIAQSVLENRALTQWVVMETVDDAGVQGVLKRLEYTRLFFRWRNSLEGVLATGHTTADWVVARGVPADRVYPFAYFLPSAEYGAVHAARTSGPFRFLFVGQFIELKRLDALIRALRGFIDRFEFELLVVGSGPLEIQWKEEANAALPGRVRWIGRLPQDKVPAAMDQADCLVLPSRHDGWGAVVSEALMVGVPVICSDACGAAAAVKASGVGGAFRVNDAADLQDHLYRAMQAGPLAPAERRGLARWASCLGASAGADYLLKIIAHRKVVGDRPVPPWAVASPEVIQPLAQSDQIKVESAS